MAAPDLLPPPVTSAEAPFPPPQLVRQPFEQIQRERDPWLSVVIVNYHQWDQTAALARQILDSPAAADGLVEVVVVDNHSKPQRLVGGLRRKKGMSIRCWRQNRGFSKAVNEGCRLSRGHWLLLLNPDVSVGERFVEEVMSLTARLPAIEPPAAIVGFRLHDRDGGWQRSTGEFPTLAGTTARLILPRSRRKYNTPRNDRASQVPWVTGCCMLVRRDCLEQLGGFDEDYFLYYEDVDLCHRARTAGWTVWYEPKVEVVHHYPLHGRKVPTSLRVFTRHAFLVYCAKHWPKWQLRMVASMIRWESRLRQWWARRRGRVAEGNQFAELRAIALDIARGRSRSVQRRLARIVHRSSRSGGS